MTDFKNEIFMKGGAYEDLIRNSGWKYISEYIAQKVANFTNKAIIEGFKNIEEYNLYRGEVVGLQNLLAEVSVTLQHLKNLRDEKSETPTAE